MIEKLPELVNNNEALIRRGRWLNDVFLVEVGEIQYLVHVTAGRVARVETCLLYTSPSPRDKRQSRMPSSA